MQKIYIAKPGGQKEGPFSLEEINRDLATKKINDTDFWAWHEGLPAWMPLYSVPGVSAKAGAVIAPAVKPLTGTPRVAAQIITLQVKPEPTASTPPGSQAAAQPTIAKAAPGSITDQAKPHPAVSLPDTASAIPTKPETERPKTAAITPAAVKPVAASPEVKGALPHTPATDAISPKAESADPSAVKSDTESPGTKAAIAPAIKLEPEKPKCGGETPTVVKPAAVAPKEEPVEVVITESDATKAESEPKSAEVFVTSCMSSGKPFAALEYIFVFTTGEGPSAFKSEVTTAMIAEAAGEKLQEIRAQVPVDVIGGADARVLEEIRGGSIPSSAWRALYKIKPAVAQQAQEGGYHLCIRTFSVESKDLVALFLLYNKQKL